MPVPLLSDFGAAALRSCVKKTNDGPQARRSLGSAAIHEGSTRAASRSNDRVCRQTVESPALSAQGAERRRPSA